MSWEDRYDPDFQPSTKGNTQLEKLTGRILNVHEDYRTTLSDPKSGKDRNKFTDRANRAVSEQVLDDRIVRILLKLLHHELIHEVNGCLATGKEANVYHAVTNTGVQRVLKIYKSTILTFKNRDRYVSGEYRFRTGYCRSNPRKLTAMWAEKEMRNLKRLQTGGIASPAVYAVKQQVLLMDFIPEAPGSQWPAPRLKDWTGDVATTQSLYCQCLEMLRRLYHECHLVHADLSEYNLLVGDGGTRLYMIDVSQSVEHEHPRALDFLRLDCRNVVDFFGRQRGLSVPTVRGLFEFVTAKELNVPVLEYIDQLSSLYPAYDEDEDAHDDNEKTKAVERDRKQRDAVDFEHMLLPQNIQQARHDEQMDLYAKMTGATISTLSLSSASEDDDAEDELAEAIERTEISGKPELSNEELQAQRKEHKRQVKEANRERRQTSKFAKHLKKRATKRKH